MASIIGVETLQHTNGTTAATIDSSGRITTPARPAFMATVTTARNQASGVITYDSEKFDIGGNYDTTNSRFTAPVDGLYQFSFTYYSVTTADARAALYKNGTMYTRGGRAINPTGSDTASSENTMIIELDANDYVDIRHDQGSVHTNVDYTYFCGHLVG